MSASPPGSDDDEHVDAVGVITALERTCELEAKLRQAIQDTHPLTTTLDWDFHAADREREALLAISEQLEYLEDRLREYRFLEPSELDNKAVLLGQVDGVRRELVDVVRQFLPHIVFGLEVAREVLAFAQVAEDASISDPEEGDGEGVEGEGEGEEGVDGEQRLPPGRRHHSHSHSHHHHHHGHRGHASGSGGHGSQAGFASEIEVQEEGADGEEDYQEAAAAQRARRGKRTLYACEQQQQEGDTIPAVRRSGAGQLSSKPPRYPTQQQGKEQGLGGLHGAKQQAGTVSPTSLHQQHQAAYLLHQQQQQGLSPNRSAFLQQQQPDQGRGRGYPQHQAWGPERPLGAHTVPGTGATVSALNAVTASRTGRLQADAEAAARRLVVGVAAAAPCGSSSAGVETYSFAPAAAAVAAAQPSYPSAAPSTAAPSSAAPSEGVPSARQTPNSARTCDGSAPSAGAAAAPAAGAADQPPIGGSRTFLLSKLNHAHSERGSGGPGASLGGSRYGAYSRTLRDEDIYGALEGSTSRPASIMSLSPRQYGGFVKISDRLSDAREEGAEKSQSQGLREERRSPMPPRIYSDAGHEEWEAGSEIQPAAYAASLSLEPISSRRESQLAARPASPAQSRLPLVYSSGGAGAASHSQARRPAQGSGGGDDGDSSRHRGGGGLLGRMTNLLLTGAAAAAVAVVAQHAAPVVVQKGQVAAKALQGQQQQLSSKWQAHQQRRRDQKRLQEQQQQGAAASQRMADAPPMGRSFRGADGPPRAAARSPGAAPARSGSMADLPPWQQQQQVQKQQPAAAPQRRQGSRISGGGADPLPPHLAAAVNAVATPASHAGSSYGYGGPQRSPPVARVHPPPHGQLFPAMPPPDVSASMG